MSFRIFAVPPPRKLTFNPYISCNPWLFPIDDCQSYPRWMYKWLPTDDLKFILNGLLPDKYNNSFVNNLYKEWRDKLNGNPICRRR